jgi:hypothetical protein
MTAAQKRQFLAQEQRRSERYDLPSQVNIEYVQQNRKMHEGDEPQRFWVATRNISRSGIGFFWTRMMFCGEQVRVELRLDGGALRYVTATVVRCRRVDETQFEIGAVFVEREPTPQPDPKPGPADGADA